MPIPFTILDAFVTPVPGSGNAAAVCLLEEEMADAALQRIAAEFNLSETAFLRRDEVGWHIRWFTPGIEVDLCGHATLAAGGFLAAHFPEESAWKLHSRSGPLGVKRVGESFWLDFPSRPPRRLGADDPRTRAFPEAVAVADGGTMLLVELPDAAAVQAFPADHPDLARSAPVGVIITARAEEESPAAIVSRFFAPNAGIVEDPVTGSAHCLLAPWWAERIGREFTAWQASPRGGLLEVRLEGDRVHLGGQVRPFAQGELV